MNLVIIESPHAGDLRLNRRYLKQCILDCLYRREAPFASHGFYTMVLKDEDSTQREIGMNAGWAWMRRSDLVAVYTNLGISDGMKKGVERAMAIGVPIEKRQLPEYVMDVVVASLNDQA